MIMIRFKSYLMQILLVLFCCLYGARISIGAEGLVFYNLNDLFLQKINDFRAQPLEIAKNLGLSEEEIYFLWQIDSFLLYQGENPLILNEALCQAAKATLEDMFEKVYFAHVSPEGLTPRDRVIEYGYQPIMVTESLAFVAFENYLSPEEAAHIVLNWLFQNALLRKDREGAPFLFPVYQDLGLALAAGQINFEGKQYNFYFFCFLFGVPEGYMGSYIFGRLYDDQNGDDFFTPGEGLDQAVLSFQSLSGEQTIITHTFPDGSFFIPSSEGGVLQVNFKGEVQAPRICFRAPDVVFLGWPPHLKNWLNLANVGQF